MGLVLGGIATIVSVVFAILSLVNGKGVTSLIWFIVFIFSITILIFSIVQVVRNVTDKVKTGAEWIHEEGDRMVAESIDYKVSERQDWIDTLKFYVSEPMQKVVPPDFYENKEHFSYTNGSFEAPFIYPYFFRIQSNHELGDLVGINKEKVIIHNVAQLAFDKNYAILKIDNSLDTDQLKNNIPEVAYILFDLQKGTYQSFPNREKLKDAAEHAGYKGDYFMHELIYCYRGWLEEDTD